MLAEASLPRFRTREKSALRVGIRWAGRGLACLGMVAVLVLSTPIVSWWAHAYAVSLDQPSGDILIVLSAAGDDASGMSPSSYWRARMAAWAWRTGGFRTIVISGHGGRGIRDFLIADGVPAGAIVGELQSQSTYESALDTGRIVQGMPGVKVLLTSDFHMFRAMRVFRRAGIAVVPMAVPDVLHATEHWEGRISGFQIMLAETAMIADYELHGWM